MSAQSPLHFFAQTVGLPHFKTPGSQPSTHGWQTFQCCTIHWFWVPPTRSVTSWPLVRHHPSQECLRLNRSPSHELKEDLLTLDLWKAEPHSLNSPGCLVPWKWAADLGWAKQRQGILASLTTDPWLFYYVCMLRLPLWLLWDVSKPNISRKKYQRT